MDSRLIAGAYSQHFRALEKEEKDEESERSDSIARAKKLSQETNKRRKIQAHKRKLEAKKEEQRRQEILTKRREEQKQATERYQRSHVPAGVRLNSGRLSPQRYAAPCLDDALHLIKRSPRRERPGSGRERTLSPQNENDDPLRRPYFRKPRHHSARPSSGRSSHQLNNEARAELMDFSLKNLTSSKSLFEQQLEQQQHLLLQKQQQSLREFSNAVQRELESGNEIGNGDDEGGAEINDITHSLSGSCSSLDSLERSGKADRESDFPKEKNENVNSELDSNKTGMANDSSSQRQTFYLNGHIPERQNNDSYSGQARIPLNQDLTPSAIFQNENISNFEQNFNANGEGKQNISHPAGGNGLTKMELLDQQNSNIQNNFKSPLKQYSGDSLEESESSSSVISLIKISESSDPKSKVTDLPGASNVRPNVGETKQHNMPSMSNQGNYHKSVMNDGSNKRESSMNDQTLGNSSSQMAWEPQSNGQGTNDKNVFPVHAARNEPVVESYNPRYASAIGLSIWPGHNPVSSSPSLASTGIADAHNLGNNSPYGKRTSSMSLGPASTNPTQQNSTVKSPVPQQPQGFHLGNRNENMNTFQSSPLSVNPSVISTKTFVPEVDNSNMLTSFKKQDFIYPLSQQSPVPNNIPQNHKLLPSHATSTYNTLQQEIKQMSEQILEKNLTAASPYPPHSGPNIHNAGTTAVAVPSSSPMQQLERIQMIHHIPHANDFASGPVPVPAVRTVFPMNKPPVPNTLTANQSQFNKKNQLPDKAKPTAEDDKENDSSKPSTGSKSNDSAEVEEVLENTKSLKGILKQLPPKVPAPGQQKGTVNARDSLELAKMQNDKKVKKKSVRFAAFVEENEDEYNAEDLSRSHVAGTNSYNAFHSSGHTLNRPASAKAVSQSSQHVPSSKPIRAASAGSLRQPVSLIQPATLHQQNSNMSIENSARSGQNNHLNNLSKSNLPPQFSHPLNTTAPINRPRAAAHIIMSSETHNYKDGNGSTSTAASSLHKSQLEMKVKTVNNNFMSKVPVKVNTNNNNTEVYHVANPAIVGIVPSEYSQQKDMIQTQQNIERSRIRDNNSSSKRVPLSNSTITRTSIVPASTKINYPISNGMAPSYSTTTSNNNTQGSIGPTFDENKMRLDKTPTDEEISWLWDKVRNCLDKDGEKIENKQPPNNGTEQTARQTPILSTKIIDGTSLGLNTNGAPALRPGSGYFYGRNGGSPAVNGQNKIKPAVQQQGSYLRRYGLLQQRRANSASGTPSGPLAIQARAGSAGLMRYPTMHSNQQGQQQQQVEGPKSIAFSYKPQDNVSESTAAFVMAERLAKQSLTDSHIGLAMEDAQGKQETFNRARMGQKGPAGGPSALSIEEQRLMESLDKLNERLNAPEPKSYTGTIHYHQPYQPHLPGFRGHQGFTNSRHQQLSPRGHQRSQSARIHQQIRQYR